MSTPSRNKVTAQHERLAGQLTDEERAEFKRRAADNEHRITEDRPNGIPGRNRVIDQHARLSDTLKSVTLARLLELHRRAQRPTRDAYPANTSNGTFANAISDPTLAAVLRDAGGYDDPDTWTDPPDPALEAGARVLGFLLGETLKWATLLDKALTHALSLGDSQPRRPSQSGAGTCHVCDVDVPGIGDNRLRATAEGGACDACRKAYDRAGKPQAGAPYQAWLRERRDYLAVPNTTEHETAGHPHA